MAKKTIKKYPLSDEKQSILTIRVTEGLGTLKVEYKCSKGDMLNHIAIAAIEKIKHDLLNQ